MKKIISLLLVVLMLSTVFVGCNQDKNDDGEGTVSAGASTGEYNGLEARDYGGKELVFQTYSTGSHCSQEDLIGDANGGPVQRGIYMRNTILQEKYNVTLANIDIFGSSSTVNEIEKHSLAQDGAIDYVLSNTQSTMTCGINGYTLEVDDVLNIQLDKEWWYTDFMDSTKVQGKNFFLIGDFAYTSWVSTSALLFNQSMAETYGIDSNEIFELVRDGKWSIEKLTQYSKLVHEDRGEEGPSLDDIFGFWSNSMAVDAFLASCDIRFITHDQNGVLKAEADQKFYDWYTWMYNLAHDDTTCYVDATESFAKYDRNAFPNLFVKEQSLFGMSLLPKENSPLRDVEFTYLYLPCPKYNENQDKYYSWLANLTSSSIAVMDNGEDTEMYGRIVEDFTFYSYMYLRPNYYETLLDGIMASSTTFVEMLDYIVGIYSVDLMSLFCNQIPFLNGPDGTLRQAINKFGNTSPAALLKRNQSSWGPAVEKILTQVDKLSQ